MRRVILKNWQNVKSEQPQIIQIDALTRDAKRLTKLKRRDLKEMRQDGIDKLTSTFLPVDYPHSVAPEYLPFTIYSNMSSIAFTAMLFLST